MKDLQPKIRIEVVDHKFSLYYRGFGANQIGWPRYWLLLVAIAGQLITIIITWQLWQVRIDPPNLPVFEVPEFSFGILLVASLFLVLLDPCRGFLAHVLLVVVASLFDQFRMQPQFLAMIVLMFAALSARDLVFCRWFLAAMWFWAGLHKLLSPHWFAHASYWILEGLKLDRRMALELHTGFAVAVALSEIALGIVAMFASRLAAFFCTALHLSICVVLVTIHWNYSVLPWNVATAIVGFWVLSRCSTTRAGLNESVANFRLVEILVAATLLIAPAGFYFGKYDHGYANVLYSDYVPRALITGKSELREIQGWAPVHVPFPYERRTHKQFFESVAMPGDKLHLFDPRPALGDQFFVLADSRVAIEVSRDQFFEETGEQVAGVAIDDRYAKFFLRQWGNLSQRKHNERIGVERDNLVSFAYTLKPDFYSQRALLLLQGIPNLEQLQLRGCPVSDEDLRHVAKLDRLTGVGLNDTGVSDAGLKHLAGLRNLSLIEIENTRISPGGLRRLKKSLGL